MVPADVYRVCMQSSVVRDALSRYDHGYESTPTYFVACHQKLGTSKQSPWETLTYWKPVVTPQQLYIKYHTSSAVCLSPQVPAFGDCRSWLWSQSWMVWVAKNRSCSSSQAGLGQILSDYRFLEDAPDTTSCHQKSGTRDYSGHLPKEQEYTRTHIIRCYLHRCTIKSHCGKHKHTHKATYIPYPVLPSWWKGRCTSPS